MSVKEDAIFFGAVAIGLMGVGYIAFKMIGGAVGDAVESVAETAEDAAEAVNPNNPDNIINSVFTDGYQWITGSEGTLGSDIADIFIDDGGL